MQYLSSTQTRQHNNSTILIYGIALLCLLIFSSYPLQAQKLPVRNFVSKAETVSFPPTISFNEAIEVLSQLALNFSGKIIIDLTEQSGPINIDVPPSHWKKVLEYLLATRDLEYVEKAAWFEIRYSSMEKAATAGLKEPEVTADTRSIEISAIFFQGDRRVLKESGINWNALLDKLDLNIISLGGMGVSQEFLSVAGKYTANDGSITIDGILNTFEALNIGEIITRPTIQVMDGSEGKIQVGQQFSIKQKDFAGNTIEQFFDVGSILSVTPNIYKDQDITFIHLKLSAEKSSATPDPVSTKIDKQLAETNVLLLDGEQTVIAGLFSEEETEVRKGIPVLKDLPWWVLGIRYLTGFNSKDNMRKELVIFIKASIVPTLAERIESKKINMHEELKLRRENFDNRILKKEN
ncbi:MAG: type II and III secretion system protein [Candidatus Marinimicrobia bacterium]|nr:type II and III secretion system protein [Candidatus Neomarinimicrobiota bacterium]